MCSIIYVDCIRFFSVKGSASGQRTIWESYHSPSSRQHPVDNVAGRPHGNLQLHPNYGAALQVRTNKELVNQLPVLLAL